MKNQLTIQYPHLLAISLTILTSTPIYAQITPDNTLGIESSRITPNLQVNGVSLDLINGGAIRDSNLFHSFTQFNVGNGQNVYFVNPAGVNNILTRVTGSNPSNILGRLGVAGGANLFLMNPNGILFGNNAQLDVRGSFVSSTANAIQFKNQGIFSATNPELPPLLNVNPSALLFNQLNPQPIQSQAQLSNNGQSLLLVGGGVNLEKSQLINPGGKVEIGGLAAPGSVGLIAGTKGYSLDFPQNIARADISINNGSRVDVKSSNHGSISIYAGNADISGSVLLAGIDDTALANQTNQAGDILVNATKNVSLRNQSGILNSVGFRLGATAVGKGGNTIINANSLAIIDGSSLGTTVLGRGVAGDVVANIRDNITLSDSTIASFLGIGAIGTAGNVIIDTGSLTIKNGSLLGAIPFQAQGRPGNIIVNARDNVTLDGNNSNDQTGIVSASLFSDSRGSDLTINTGSLYVTNGAYISSATFSKGDGGNITINARDEVVFDGVANQPITLTNGISVGSLSRADSSVAINAEGRGGDININAGSLFVRNGAILNSSSAGKGNAGNIIVNARKEVVFDGVSKFGDPSGAFSIILNSKTAQGGNISVSADTLRINNQAGITTSTVGLSGNAGNVIINTRGNVNLTNRSSLSTTTYGIGNAGKISIDSDGTVFLDDNAGILAGAISLEQEVIDSAKKQGFTTINLAGLDEVFNFFTPQVGDANDVVINARSLQLKNNSFVSTFTTSGNGGNIQLGIEEVLLLRKQSNVTTTAGFLQRSGNGGNINIDAPFIVAIPKENSNIEANAFSGTGGNVIINTQGLFGIQASSQLTLASEITASSELGVQGQINITQPEVQPTQGIIELPEDVVDATRQIAQTCPRGIGDKPLGNFVVTGRDNLPPNPIGMLSGDSKMRNLATLDEKTSGHFQNVENTSINSTIIEAQGWVKSRDGGVILVAKIPQSKQNLISTMCNIVSE